MNKFEEFRFKYPNAFITDKAPYGFIFFGFECGLGWADLLEPLFKEIDRHNTEILKSQTEFENLIQIRQVKEKFGTLRFYYDCHTDKLEMLINKAEELSEKTCETCGKPGSMRGTSWFYVACDEHTKEGDKKNENV